MKKVLSVLAGLSILIFSSTLFSCSSGPKRSMLITTVLNSCNSSLEAANGAILSGDYEKAQGLLSTAQNQAVSIDNSDLLISVNLAYISLCLSYNPPRTDDAKLYLTKMEKLIEPSNNKKYSESLFCMAKTRILIAEKKDIENIDSIIEEMDKALKGFKDDSYNLAQCYSIIGDLYRINSDYKSAQKYYEDSVKIYTNEHYLSEIGITWYKIAQNYSLSGNKKGALEALNSAIYYDRCAENSMALGADYYIKGVILLKGNPTSAEIEKANDALIHSAEIYNAINLPELAQKSLNLVNNN